MLPHDILLRGPVCCLMRIPCSADLYIELGWGKPGYWARELGKPIWGFLEPAGWRSNLGLPTFSWALPGNQTLNEQLTGPWQQQKRRCGKCCNGIVTQT